MKEAGGTYPEPFWFCQKLLRSFSHIKHACFRLEVKVDWRKLKYVKLFIPKHLLHLLVSKTKYSHWIAWCVRVDLFCTPFQFCEHSFSFLGKMLVGEGNWNTDKNWRVAQFYFVHPCSGSSPFRPAKTAFAVQPVPLPFEKLFSGGNICESAEGFFKGESHFWKLLWVSYFLIPFFNDWWNTFWGQFSGFAVILRISRKILFKNSGVFWPLLAELDGPQPVPQFPLARSRLFSVSCACISRRQPQLRHQSLDCSLAQPRTTESFVTRLAT